MNGSFESESVGAISLQLIVFDVDANSVAATFPIAFPMIANAITHKFEVSIEQLLGFATLSG